MPRKRKSSYANTPHAQRMRLRRQSESCDAREERLSRQRQRQTESRQNETLGEHQERQEQDRFRHMVAKINESEEERQQRLIADRNRYQNLKQREIQNAKRSALLYDKNDPCNKAAIGEMTKLCQCGAKKFAVEKERLHWINFHLCLSYLKNCSLGKVNSANTFCQDSGSTTLCLP
ncbi:hypothetical protein Hamer_G010053 [Homarus americanus]|uniref:Uncharacterized protein n=1 Tax=Homarus americanus TaxID=6706 RepID=A0A8J5MMU5_HOMAM|nr:hypothetical protein Hamer_G010053 [Homarus americanus]